MKVKELIVQLLNEDMDDEVVIFTSEDIAIVDGIKIVADTDKKGFCSLSCDVPLTRKF